MTRLRGVRAALTATTLVAGVLPCPAADICDAVLNSRAFDTYESTTVDNLATRAIDNICNTKWSSKDDFTERVRKWDSSFSYIDIFKGTGNANVSQQNRTVDQDYQQFCQNADNSYLRNYLKKSRTQLTDTAVKAWESCIKTTQQTGLFSRAIVSQDKTLVTIAVRFIPAGVGDKLVLRGYDHSRYTCSLLGQDTVDFDLSAKGLGNSVDIACFPKDTQSELHVAIETSQNQTIGPFVIPSKAYLDLQQMFGALSMRADELDASLASAKTDLAKTKAAINEQFKKLTGWGTDLGDKSNDATIQGEWGYNTTDPTHGGSCAAGAVLTGIQMGAPYKLRYRCRMLPALNID